MDSRTVHGWVCNGKDQPLVWSEQPRKTFDEDTVDLNITHCGICASDLFTLDSGWGKTDYPCIVGHEIVGVVTRVGKNVKNVQVGDRAGVGAQCMSCLQCHPCQHQHENLCPDMVGTYNGRWPRTNERTFGGYADVWSGHYNFVFKIPDELPSEVAATFFCAGVTTYAPMKRYNVNSQSVVGVIGIGGLGHFAVQWGKALGAKVVALSHSDRKREDAKKLGCDDYFVTGEKESLARARQSLTHIICTSFGNNFDWGSILGLLKPGGVFIMVAIPSSNLTDIPPIFVPRQLTLAGSCIGSPEEIREMLDFACKTGVRPWISKYPMTEAPEAVQAMRDGKARYRFVLEN
ncbi:chaperonin 10-like protein [Dichotomocladium elegans]|nr:chaperonin 10-like protein [Dichotomocladium elegans]